MDTRADITLILFLENEIGVSELDKYQSKYSQLIIVSSKKQPLLKGKQDIEVLTYNKKNGKVNALNNAIASSTGTHILWLEEGESISLISPLQEAYNYIAKIPSTNTEITSFNRQIRIFQNDATNTLAFRGYEIPDIYSAIQAADGKIAEKEFTIERNRPLFLPADIQREVEHDKSCHFFWKALWATGENHFSRACTYFKKALKDHNLAPWNRLAALNGLANALMETRQPEEARSYAQQSISEAKNQRAPYLTLHQYHTLNGNHEKAYEVLSTFRSLVDVVSDANWDVHFPVSEATFLMAEIAYRMGWHKQAHNHYEEFFELNEGHVSQAILEKLFVYAVELGEQERAKFYFEKLFGKHIPNNLDADCSSRISEALALFTDKGWYDFPSSMYQKLVACRPKDTVLRQGCIRTLIRNNEIEKAQALL